MKDSFHWKHSIGIVFSIFIVWLLFAILLLPFQSTIDVNSNWISVLSQLGILVVLILAIKVLSLHPSITYRHFEINWIQFISIVCIAFLFSLISLPLNVNFWMNTTFNLDAFDRCSRLNFPHMLSAYLMAPIIEEGLFRGVILRNLLQRYSSWIAIMLTSVLFAIIHIDLSYMFFYFISGIFLSTVYYKTNSLLMTMLLHLFMNIGIDIVYYQRANLDAFINSSYYWGCVIAGVVIIVLFFYNIRCLALIGQKDKTLILK